MNKLQITLVVLLMSGLTNVATARETVGIPEVVPFDQSARVPQAVRVECQLGEKVSRFVKKYGGKDVEFSKLEDSGRYVDMAITAVHAPGGGAYSGPKWMEVQGTLLEDGKKVASFRAQRFSTGGAFGGFKGTCAIIGRCTKAIGKDIANWLRQPYDGAALGDAR